MDNAPPPRGVRKFIGNIDIEAMNSLADSLVVRKFIGNRYIVLLTMRTSSLSSFLEFLNEKSHPDDATPRARNEH